MQGPSEVINEKIGFIGGGNMAKTICEDITKKGLIKYFQIFVSAPQTENLSWWTERGTNVYTENGKLIQEVGIVIFAVKRNSFDSAIANIYETLQLPMEPKLFISIVSGITLEKLENDLRPMKESARVIRVLPNTPITVGEGCTVFCPGIATSSNDLHLVKSIFGVSSICFPVPESILNVTGALVGSGLAFIYLIIEALSDAGVKQGIPRDRAIEMAAQTTLGAAKMVLDTGKHPAVLRDDICCLHRTTMAGIYALESAGVRASMFKALQVATSKSEELAYEED